MSKKKKTLEELLEEINYIDDNKNIIYLKLGSLIQTQKGKKPKELMKIKKK